MPNVLKKIKDSNVELLSLNQNFDNISKEMAENRGIFSSVAYSAVTVSAGSVHVIDVSVADNRELYTINLLPIIPRVNVYIDYDGNNGFRYPVGSSLSTAQRNDISVEVLTLRTVYEETTDEKASFAITIRNASATDITAYCYIQAFYLPGPDLGIATR